MQQNISNISENISEKSLAEQRANMVEGQLRPHKVNQPLILARFSAVPRETFVASPATAYLDQPATLAPHREMFSPMVAARLIQALAVTPGDTILVAAAGTGYTATILAPLCQQVVAVEDDAALAKQAESNFLISGITNVQLVIDNPTHGYAGAAPYAAILIDAPFAELPSPLIDQLADGGRLVGVRIGQDGLPEATVFTKHGTSKGHALITETLFETKGTVHPAFASTEKFIF